MQNWLSSLLGILAAVFVSYPRVHPSVSYHTADSALSWSLPLMTVYLGPQWELMLELLGVVGTQTMACPCPCLQWPQALGTREAYCIFIRPQKDFSG